MLQESHEADRCLPGAFLGVCEQIPAFRVAIKSELAFIHSESTLAYTAARRHAHSVLLSAYRGTHSLTADKLVCLQFAELSHATLGVSTSY
ncbi:unnamed protein product, partial [Brenthis ino]